MDWILEKGTRGVGCRIFRVDVPGVEICYGYMDQEGKVVYISKDSRASKSFPALEWPANLCSHIPNRGEQKVRYYGYYSNVSRGKRQLAGRDDAVPAILEPMGNSKTFRRNWARLIQKIYEVDPLVCPKCQGSCGSSAASKIRR